MWKPSDCGGEHSEQWAELKAVLEASARYPNFKEEISPEFRDFLPNFEWFSRHYQECIQGFVSMVLYASFHHQPEAMIKRGFGGMFSELLGWSIWLDFGIVDGWA